MIPDTPPVETPILFLAGEWGCTPHWYHGFCWQSKGQNQEMQFYVYPEYFGFDPKNPPFHAPPYLGEWKLLQKTKDSKP